MAGLHLVFGRRVDGTIPKVVPLTFNPGYIELGTRWGGGRTHQPPRPTRKTNNKSRTVPLTRRIFVKAALNCNISPRAPPTRRFAWQQREQEQEQEKQQEQQEQQQQEQEQQEEEEEQQQQEQEQEQEEEAEEEEEKQEQQQEFYIATQEKPKTRVAQFRSAGGGAAPSPCTPHPPYFC